LIAADEPEIESAAQKLREFGVAVDAVETDRATLNGVDKLYRGLANGRQVDALLANAGRGTRQRFSRSGFSASPACHDIKITGTLYLVHKVGRQAEPTVAIGIWSSAPGNWCVENIF
jgi:short-subunit dehydrogenase